MARKNFYNYGRKEGMKEGNKEGRNERTKERKGGRKEGREEGIRWNGVRYWLRQRGTFGNGK
jgi:hypothetical protein